MVRAVPDALGHHYWAPAFAGEALLLLGALRVPYRSNGFFGARSVSRTGTAPKPKSRRMPVIRYR